MLEDFYATLNQTNIANNNNKYYIIQVCRCAASPRRSLSQVLQSGGQFYAWNRWGACERLRSRFIRAHIAQAAWASRARTR